MNIILIGMPGAGKSTIGVLLAKALGMRFIDTDIVLQEQENRLLHEIISTDGIERFLETEEAVVSSLKPENSVIATGGSVVYSSKAMNALRGAGISVFLYVPFEEIERRLKNIKTRGVVIPEGKSLKDVYEERMPLYMAHSDIRLDCTGKDIETVVAEAIEALKKYSYAHYPVIIE